MQDIQASATISTAKDQDPPLLGCVKIWVLLTAWAWLHDPSFAHSFNTGKTDPLHEPKGINPRMSLLDCFFFFFSVSFLKLAFNVSHTLTYVRSPA